MYHFICILWALFAIEHNDYYDKVDTYCPSYNIDTSGLICDVNINLIEHMSNKEYKDYVFVCLSKKNKMFLL